MKWNALALGRSVNCGTVLLGYRHAVGELQSLLLYFKCQLLLLGVKLT